MATTPKKTRIKAPALLAPAPQHRAECAAWIKTLGDEQRALIREEAAMNDELAAITERWHAALEARKAKIMDTQAGIQAWCEANREELTENGKTKTANLITGAVQWRQRPPSCRVTGIAAVIQLLYERKLDRFVRVKEEVNKEAILNEPDAVYGVPGITVVSGVEDFVVTPFEQEAA